MRSHITKATAKKRWKNFSHKKASTMNDMMMTTTKMTEWAFVGGQNCTRIIIIILISTAKNENFSVNFVAINNTAFDGRRHWWYIYSVASSLSFFMDSKNCILFNMKLLIINKMPHYDWSLKGRLWNF